MNTGAKTTSQAASSSQAGVGRANNGMAPGEDRASTPPPGPAAIVTTRAQAAEAGVAPGDAAAQLQSFLAELLQRQCELAGAIGGIIYLAGSAARPGGLGATFMVPTPPGQRPQVSLATDQTLVTRMCRIGEEVVADPSGEAKVEAITLQPDGPSRGMYQATTTHRLLACPLVAAEQVHGASVLLLVLPSPIEPAEAVTLVRLAGGAYESFIWQQQCMVEAHAKTRLRETLELIDAAQQGGDAETMGSLFCHELQRRFGCTRVSIGLVRQGRLRLAAVSGADQLDRRGGAAESIESAMEECADQDVEVVYPPTPEAEANPAGRRVTRAHAMLSQRHGPAAIVSLPLRVEGDLVGVVLLEREPSDPFPPAAVPLLRLVAEFIGPALWTRRLADRGVLAVVRDRAMEVALATVGPRHTAAKLVGLALILLLVGSLIPIPGRITAECETDAAVSRTIPPPYPGFLQSVRVRPGDRVEKGDVLAAMDVSEVQLELDKATSKLASLRTQRDDAMGKHQLGDAAIASAAIEESNAEIKLFEDRLSRGQIRAPISGVLSRGEIEALQGARVEPTTPLFEIVDPGRLVVTLRVRERDIGRVSVGQEGAISPTALPGERLKIRVTRIRPAAEVVKESNVYFVEAELLEEAAWLKPGMTGTARLKKGWTTMMATVLGPVIDEARLRLWW